jgi:hypothetical protein
VHGNKGSVIEEEEGGAGHGDRCRSLQDGQAISGPLTLQVDRVSDRLVSALSLVLVNHRDPFAVVSQLRGRYCPVSANLRA